MRGTALSRRRPRANRTGFPLMLLVWVSLVFVVLIVLSMPIVFSLGLAGVFGLWLGGYPMQQVASALVSGSQSWVLLAIPAFVFAGALMERCGMSHALVEFARALVGWVRGGLGMSVILVAYFFSDICGSKMAEVSALGSTLMPPLTKAGYDKADSASLIAAGTAMGMLVPPAIFMIVISQVTNTSPVQLFVAGFVPAAVIMLCLMALVYVRARALDWPRDSKPSLSRIWETGKRAAVPLVVPIVILVGFVGGVITATEAGAVVAGYAVLAAKLFYRNVSWREMAAIAHESAILTASVIFLLAVASIYQYLMGVSGVPQMLGTVLAPLGASHFVSLRDRADHHAVRHAARRVACGRRADPGRLSDCRGHRYQPDPLQHRADRRGRHRLVPAADGRRALDGAEIRRAHDRAALANILALPGRAVRRSGADHYDPGPVPVAAAHGGIDPVNEGNGQ